MIFIILAIVSSQVASYFDVLLQYNEGWKLELCFGFFLVLTFVLFIYGAFICLN